MTTKFVFLACCLFVVGCGASTEPSSFIRLRLAGGSSEGRSLIRNSADVALEETVFTVLCNGLGSIGPGSGSVWVPRPAPGTEQTCRIDLLSVTSFQGETYLPEEQCTSSPCVLSWADHRIRVSGTFEFPLSATSPDEVGVSLSLTSDLDGTLRGDAIGSTVVVRFIDGAEAAPRLHLAVLWANQLELQTSAGIYGITPRYRDGTPVSPEPLLTNSSGIVRIPLSGIEQYDRIKSQGLTVVIDNWGQNESRYDVTF